MYSGSESLMINFGPVPQMCGLVRGNASYAPRVQLATVYTRPAKMLPCFAAIPYTFASRTEAFIVDF